MMPCQAWEARHLQPAGSLPSACSPSYCACARLVDIESLLNTLLTLLHVLPLYRTTFDMRAALCSLGTVENVNSADYNIDWLAPAPLYRVCCGISSW